MAQELAITLITDAMYLSSLVSRQFESVSNDKLADGLNLLNKFLQVQTAGKGLIPYYVELPIFFTVPGIEKYALDAVTTVSSVTFFYGDVRYQMQGLTRDQNFATYRALNFTSLPRVWHFEPSLVGGDLYLYPKPDLAYEMHVWVKKEFDEVVTFNRDLLTLFRKFYIEYIRYGLAQYICDFYQIATPMNVEDRLASLIQELSSRVGPKDFSPNTKLTLGRRSGLNWARINLSNGFEP